MSLSIFHIIGEKSKIKGYQKSKIKGYQKSKIKGYTPKIEVYISVKYMQFIKSIINKLLPKKSPKHLGRWRLADTNKQINHKVDLSNVVLVDNMRYYRK